ncbi:unnamed protein product, partial [marine sediment metagenome]
KNIVFMGYRSDIEAINNIIDIAVVPSIGFEAVPYTIKEAMRAGKSVITTDAGGCDEAVIHNRNGFVVPQKDPHMLAQAIMKLLEEKELMGQMGCAGQQYFKQKFILSEKVLEHERLYKNG